MGTLPVTRPTNRGLRIAQCSERATSKPTPICIHLSLYGYKTQRQDATSHTSKGMWNNTSRGHLPLLCSRLHLKVAKFRFVKNKALSKRLFISICRDTSIPLLPIYVTHLSTKGPLRRLSMHRYGMSKSSIGCKGNKKNDYSCIFSGFFYDRVKILSSKNNISQRHEK